MSHLHTQIRGAIVTALTGLATTGPRVYANRLMALPASGLPALNVTLDEESAEGLTIHGPQHYQRRLGVVVSAFARASVGVDDILDQIGLEVEIALAGGITVDGQTLELNYTGMSFDDELGEQPTGVRRMSFDVTFTALATAPNSLS